MARKRMNSSPALKLEVVYKNPKDLIPYINNAKLHGKEQVKGIASSIKEFGFNNPVLLDGNNGVIAGHGRIQAADLLKLSSVPTIELSHLSEAQKKAYILADNRLGEIDTGWDKDLLQIELDDISTNLDLDISIVGFTDFDMSTVGDENGYKLPEEGDAETENNEDMWGLIVNFDNEHDQVELLSRLIKEGYKCKALI